MADSSKSAIGFNTPKAQETNKAEETPVQVKQPDVVDEGLNDPYFDERTITIALVKNYSLFRRSNDKVLPKRVDYIGSSVTSSRTLAANKTELETYYPNLVGVPANNPEFLQRVKKYLNNIRIPVDELGRTFNVSFHYNTKADYLKIKNEEDRIETLYNEANKSDSSKLREALNQKITRLNALETTKCTLGYPENVEDYLMYRHCLLYKDVAKDISLINSDPTIRFYFKDNKKTASALTLATPNTKGMDICAIASGTGVAGVFAGMGIVGNGALGFSAASGIGLAGMGAAFIPALWPIGISLLAISAGSIFAKSKKEKEKAKRTEKLEEIFNNCQSGAQDCNNKIDNRTTNLTYCRERTTNDRR